jgi:hypothetical protein
VRIVSRAPRPCKSQPMAGELAAGSRYDRPDRANGLSARLAFLGSGETVAVISDTWPSHMHIASSVFPGRSEIECEGNRGNETAGDEG